MKNINLAQRKKSYRHGSLPVSVSSHSQVMATLATSMCMLDIGALLAYGSVSLPRITDPDSEDLVFDTAQAAFFGSWF